MKASTMVSNRDVSIDIMRGIGILSMLVGHCVIPDLLHKFIYMWHMPLFFIASGYFFRRKDFLNTTSSSFKNPIMEQ